MTDIGRPGPLAALPHPTGGPVTRMRAPATGDPVWQVTDYRMARRVLTDRRFSRAAAALPGAPRLNTVNPAPTSMVSMDGPGHTRLRQQVAGAFAPKRIAALAPRIQRLVDTLLDDMTAAGPPADLIASFAAPLPVAVIGELLGIPVVDWPAVREWAGVLFDATASTPQEKARRGFALYGYMSELIERKRSAPSDNLIRSLTAAHDAGALTTTELVDLALAVLTAGYETTVGQLGLSVLAVLTDPGHRSALLDPRTSAPVVEEYLRLTPATPITFPRVALSDVRLGPVTVEAGAAVVVSLSHTNLDGDVFPDPSRLVPAGRTAAHLTFGHGPHFCLGAGLARSQLNLAIRALLRRLPHLRLAEDPAAVGWCEGLVTRGLTHLLVTW